MVFIYSLNICLLAALIYVMYQYEKNTCLGKWFFPALAVKLLAGLALGVIFKYHYEYGDTLNYFKEGAKFASIAQDNFGSYLNELFSIETVHFDSRYDKHPRALFLSKISSVFVFVTGYNYWLTSLYFSLFSFFGFWKLSVCLSQVFRNRLGILISLLFYPSIVFWSSGIAKESLAMGAWSLLLTFVISVVFLKRRITITTILLNLLWFTLLWKLKYYFAGALILMVGISVGLLYLIDTLKSVRESMLLQLTIVIGLGAVLIIGVSMTNPNLNLDRVAAVVYKNHMIILNKTDPEELIKIDGLKPTWSSMLKNSPEALFTGIFRPLPGDRGGVLNMLVIIENIVLLLLSMITVLSINKNIGPRYRVLVFAGILYCTVLAVFLTLSTPNFGTLVRYKIGFLPVLLLLVTLPNPTIKKLNDWVFTK